MNFKIGHGYISSICFGNREVIRRIFVTVRDRNWQEIAPTQFHAEPDSAVPGRMNLRAHHRSDLVDFKWEGYFQIWERGNGPALMFRFEGRALRDMDVCRLGLVVLHPVPPLIGNQVVVDGPEGREEICISEAIHPQPILNGIPQAMTRPFAQLSMEMAQLGSVDFKYAGDLFEFEDQRNWGDASFKTYCTPLRQGYPRSVKAGTVIEHSVTVSVTNGASTKPAGNQSAPQTNVAIHPKVPRIGRMAPSGFESMTDTSWVQGWDHIRVDLQATTEPSFIERLLGTLSSDTKLEVGLTVDEGEGISSPHLELVAQFHRRICALVVRSGNSPLPSTESMVRLREQLRGTPADNIPLLSSPNGYFVEFNRSVPFEADVDGIAFPLSSTVHSDDAETVSGNISAVIDMIRTARQLTGRPLIAISPLALYHPAATGPIRLNSAQSIPWLAGIVAHAASAGISSITLAEDVIDIFASLQREKLRWTVQPVDLCSSAASKK